MKKVLFSYLLLLPFVLHSQIITTIAGNGTVGYSGDGGPATLAQCVHLYGTAVDATGNIYVSENGVMSVVRKVSTSGIITKFAGSGAYGFGGDGGSATLAAMTNPHDICFDPAGNLYIVDSMARIRKVDVAGIITTFAGNGVVGFAGDGGPATAAHLNHPQCLVSDTSGNIYVSDNLNFRIRKISTSGIISTVAGNGTSGYSGDGGPATDAELTYPRGLATDKFGNLYIADGTARIRRVDPSGTISTFAGNGTVGFSGDGGPATLATMANIYTIRTDKAGNVYIADYLNYRIRKVDLAGNIATVAGTGVSGYSEDYCSATLAQITLVTGLAVDDSGVIYFADYYNRRVRKIVPDKVPSFIPTADFVLTTCADSGPVSVDSLLTVYDADSAQGEIWAVLYPSLHGAISAGYTMLSTGVALVPTGISYTPGTGYVGSDVFTMTITDCAGYSDTLSISIAVIDCALAVNSYPGIAHDLFRVYPNPATDVLTVSGALHRVTITDCVGRVVYDATKGGTHADIDISGFRPGLYFLTINGIETTKFVKL